jgi:hypothetical protein
VSNGEVGAQPADDAAHATRPARANRAAAWAPRLALRRAAPRCPGCCLRSTRATV